MLPEVNRRRLYEKKGFASIFEFAAKLAGLSHDQVRLALNLERRFEDKPALKQMLVEGKTSLHKLTRIASIATVENEQELAQKVNVLSKNALATLARDERVGSKSLPGQTLKFDLSDEVIEQLNLLHAQGKDVNVLLMELLKEREEKIVTKKEVEVKKIAKVKKPTAKVTKATKKLESKKDIICCILISNLAQPCGNRLAPAESESGLAGFVGSDLPAVFGILRRCRKNSRGWSFRCKRFYNLGGFA